MTDSLAAQHQLERLRLLGRSSVVGADIKWAAEEIERLTRELTDARRTAEHWKAEHLAGNAEIERLRTALAFLGKAFELADDQTDAGITYREAMSGVETACDHAQGRGKRHCYCRRCRQVAPRTRMTADCGPGANRFDDNAQIHPQAPR